MLCTCRFYMPSTPRGELSELLQEARAEGRRPAVLAPVHCTFSSHGEPSHRSRSVSCATPVKATTQRTRARRNRASHHASYVEQERWGPLSKPAASSSERTHHSRHVVPKAHRPGGCMKRAGYMHAATGACVASREQSACSKIST